MANRSLNRVMLIGNAVADITLRYTVSNDAFCTFSLATNRNWTTEKGERKEETEFHRLIAWGRIAEICNQLIKKGTKVYIQGRLSTKILKVKEGGERPSTEVVVEDMIILDSIRRDEPTREFKHEETEKPTGTTVV